MNSRIMSQAGERELTALGKELTIQNDFHARALDLLDTFARRPAFSADEVLVPWIDLLRSQPGIVACAFVEIDGSGRDFRRLAMRPASEAVESVLRGEFRERILNCWIHSQSLTAELPGRSNASGRAGGQIIVQPCRPKALKTLLVVISKPENTGFQVDYVTSFAAVTAATSLVPLSRMLAMQELAARVTHMSSSGMLVAQFRLNAALGHPSLAAPAREQIASAMTALREAQLGLDRTRLFGVPWHRCGRPIRLGPVLNEIGQELNQEAQCEVVAEASLRRCRKEENLSVRATEERLRCALRDSTLSTYLLSQQQPTQLGLTSQPKTVSVNIRGGRTGLPLSLSGPVLLDVLSDPADYFVTKPEWPAARGIGFYLPRKLVEEFQGRMVAKVSGPRRCLAVTLQLPRA